MNIRDLFSRLCAGGDNQRGASFNSTDQAGSAFARYLDSVAVGLYVFERRCESHGGDANASKYGDACTIGVRMELGGIVSFCRSVSINAVFLVVLCLAARTARPETHYVDRAGIGPLAPYTSWGTAATNIQDAVNACAEGDEVVVTNGFYVLPQHIVLDRDITVEGANGYASTIVSGNGSHRCFVLSHSNALVRGLTLTDGVASSGGAVSISAGVVQDCLLKGNRATAGGAVYLSGSGTLRNCVVVSNRVASGSSQVKGGGIYMSAGGVVESCTVVDNETIKGRYSDAGGGIYCYADGMLILNSIIYRNSSQYGVNIYHGPGTAMPAGAISHCRIGSDPLFVDIDAGNYRLKIASACVDAGLNMEWMSAVNDVIGNPRVLGHSVDMGAYEYVPVPRQLMIDSSPAHFGMAEPFGYGTYSVMELTTVTNRIAIPIVETGGVSYVCGGWAGSGSVPSSGDTNAVVFSIKEDSSLTWQWAVGHQLMLQSTNGAITGTTSGLKPEGRTYELQPWPAAGYEFDHWLVNGDSSGNDEPLDLTVSEPLVVEAVFVRMQPIDIAWEGVSHTNNVADGTGFGAVPYAYLIGKFEVTCRHYAAFLNAVARTDTYGLYNPAMFSNGGIARSGSEGRYSYEPNPGWEHKPVTYLSYYDALRFANWMHNGQPAGEQDAMATEDGAYTFTGPQAAGARNGRWKYAVTSEDEWYKAAYFDPPTGGYHKYATQSDTLPARTRPPAGPNAANYEWAVGSGLTEVGAYLDSPGPFGTYDQNGNVAEWTEGDRGSSKSVRGGSAFVRVGGSGSLLHSANTYAVLPQVETAAASSGIGFRLVGQATNGLHYLTLVATNGTITGTHEGWKPAGSTYDLFPARADGYVFDYWTVDGVNRGRGAPLNVTMSNSLLVEAVFVLARDFGDLPASYGLTMLSDDGARHQFQSLWLGATVDGEPEGQESADAGMTAGGDDGGDEDDEDGILPLGTWTEGVAAAAIRVEVSGGTGFLSGWIDWNGDADFRDAGEHVLDMAAVRPGAQVMSIDVPSGALSGGGTRFARFRLASEALPPLRTSGLAMDGEVEDYNLPLGGQPVVWLRIASPFGNPALPQGNHPCIPGTILTNRVTSPDVYGTTQYVSEGWAMTGSAPASGTNTVMVTTVTNDAVLQWLWHTQYWMSVDSGEGGTVAEPVNEWRDAGSMLAITAEPELFYEFSHWTGVPEDLSATNSLRLVVGQPREIEAHFISTYPTSQWFLCVDSANATPVPPYTNWQTAATTIQDAIDIVDSADSNAVILVRAGVYVLSSQIMLDKAIRLRSESGPEVTVIDGDDGVRCLYVNHDGAVVEGFKITRGYCASSVYPSYVGGGGVYLSRGRVSDCHIVSNSGGNAAGIGVGLRGTAELSDCVISNNVSTTGDGGGVFLNKGGHVRNCLIVRNGVGGDGGGVYCYYGGTIESCTIVDNESARRGGGVMLFGGSVVRNCIIYDNRSPTGANHAEYNGGTYTYSCTTPSPSGGGNITNTPSLVDAAGGNYRLRPDSPCVNAGLLQDWMASGTDLAGGPRVQNGAVDIGCFEVEAAFLAEPLRGLPPLDVRFGVADSLRGLTNLIYRWDFENDGIIDAEGVGLTEIRHTYIDWGSYSIRLVLSDGGGDVMSFVRVDLVSVDYDATYVSKAGSHVYPFWSWETAATNLQEGIDAAGDGRTVLVSKGVYQVAEPVTVSGGVTVRGVSGARQTVVDGCNTTQVFIVNHDAAVVEGLTITRGHKRGGGPFYGGGGVNLRRGLVQDCIIRDSWDDARGGGVLLTGGSLRNCLVFGNSVDGGTGSDGYGGGGVMLYQGGTVHNCTIVNNTVKAGGGGGLKQYHTDAWRLVTHNSIIYYNTPSDVSLIEVIQYRGIDHCCTSILPAVNDGNVTNSPLFMDPAAQDFRLHPLSPCVDSGANMDWMTNAVDLAGNPRVFRNTVDMGAYETVFVDATALIRAYLVEWQMDRQTGTYMATLELSNPSNAVKVLSAPFWFLLETTPFVRLMHPDGVESQSGLPYVDITGEAHAALLEVGDGDAELDAGECIRIGNIEVFSYDRSVPTGFVYAVWADPPGGMALASVSDADGDGIPDTWESRYGGLDLNNPADGGQDTDGDGMSNLSEYLSDTDPTNPDSILRVREIRADQNCVRLKWTGGVRSKQVIEVSTDLETWRVWHTNQAPTSITNTLTRKSGEERLYFRIRVPGR